MQHDSVLGKRAQLSPELLAMVGVAFVALVVFGSIIAQRLASVHRDAEQRSLRVAVDLLHEEIALAATVSDGYTRSFDLPSVVGDGNYTISIQQNRVILARTGAFEASRTTLNVTGQPKQGRNTITKTNGTITLN
ncbi:hypothetical protein HY642_04600 [Candidatus Woesearchaeota archaeon]|nr:hypothetical protein [Candidatus Woesearchaeota archaeon]